MEKKIIAFGVKIPGSRGGGTIAEAHEDCFKKIEAAFCKYAKEYAERKIPEFVFTWTNKGNEIIQELRISEKDLQAFQKFNEIRIDDKEINDVKGAIGDLSDFEDFAINYLCAAKINSQINRRADRKAVCATGGILTAEFVPHIIFRPWIIAFDYDIIPTGIRYDFDLETGNFVPIKASLMQQRADDRERIQIE